MRRCRATVQVPLGIAVRMYCLRPWLAGGGQDYRPAIFAMLITFYRSMPVALRARYRRVGWIGCMPGMRPAAVCQHFMTGERQGPFSSLILARFALYCHPDLLTSRSEVATCWIMSARLSSGSEQACLTIAFVYALQRVLCKTRLVYTKHCSSPRIKMSFGRFLPINTILLPRTSFSPHLAPRSLPISWCTPWKTTLRSAPCISSTPL